MSENITVNVNQGGGPNNQNVGGSSTLESILRFIVTLVAIVAIAFFIITAFLLVDNWEWIVTTFTTGFFGWLNPFDDPAEDLGPGEIVEQGVVRIPIIGPIIRIFRGF